MENHMTSVSSDQPDFHAWSAQSVTSIISQNNSENTQYDSSVPVDTMDTDDKDLDEARHAVTLVSAEHPDWLGKSCALANLLWKHFQKTNEDNLLAECIQVGRQNYAVFPIDHPDRETCISNLAILLNAGFERTGEESLLIEVIDLQREILTLQSGVHPDRMDSCRNLASSLWTRFNQTGQESLLAEAIKLQREVLSLRPHGHPSRPFTCHAVGLLLWTYFKQTGEESVLAEAINIQREALSLRHGEHPDRYVMCNNLALSLWTRFKQTSEESLLLEAIDLQKEALSLQPSGHPDRSTLCNNLAASLLIQFELIGDESLLVTVIDLQKEALSLQPSGHPDRSTFSNNLALSLWTRFNQTGEESQLVEAIELQRVALSFRPSWHPDKSGSCNNLALFLWTRFQQTREESLLAESTDFYREALSLQPKGHPDRYLSCTNLALALLTRFDLTGNVALRSEAINLQREAVSLQPSSHYDRLRSCTNLADSLRTLFDSTGDESLLEEAIDLNKEATKAQPQNHPSQWVPIINLVGIYLDRRFSQHDFVLAINYMQKAVSLPSNDWPHLLSQIAYLTGLVDLSMLSLESLSQLLQCFSDAIDLASRVAGFILDQGAQLQYLRDSQHLGPRAYWCAIACGQTELGLELIERARAMTWTQALHMRSPQISGAPPELASELEHLLGRMHTSRVPKSLISPLMVMTSISNDLLSTEQNARYRNSARIHYLLQKIRTTPGNQRFMRGLSFEELALCASRHAVVLLIATEGECHALILQPSKTTPLIIKLSDITPDELKTMRFFQSSIQKRGSAVPNNAHNNREESSSKAHSNHVLSKLWTVVVKPVMKRGSRISDTVHDGRMPMKISSSRVPSNSVLSKLWTAVVKPVIESLRLQKTSGSLRPRLHWCPTGDFMFLPLHAAGVYGTSEAECCADYVVCSYTPTLTALLRAQKSNPSFHKKEAKLGLVAAMKAWDVRWPTLWNVEDEISHVKAAAERESISVDTLNYCVGDVANVKHVAEVFESTNIAHIACHGTQNAADALSSGFCLSDGNLSVSRLMDLELKDAFFAFLSACETAKGDEKQPDQTVHLAAAMLFAGFRSIAATMWAMSDADGPRVAKLFYERLFSEDFITLDAIPYALDYAITELRQSGVPPERWATFIHMGA